MHRRRDVAVEVQGHADLRVAEHLRDDLRVPPESEEQGRRGVAKVVESDSRKASALEERPEAPTQEVRGVERPAQLVGEQEVKVAPRRASSEPFLATSSPRSPARGCLVIREGLSRSLHQSVTCGPDDTARSGGKRKRAEAARQAWIDATFAAFPTAVEFERGPAQ